MLHPVVTKFWWKNVVILLFLLLKLPDLAWILVLRNCLRSTKLCQNKLLGQQSSWVPTSSVAKSNSEIRIPALVEKTEQSFLLSSNLQILSSEKQMSFAKSLQQSQQKDRATPVHTKGTKKPNFKGVYCKMTWNKGSFIIFPLMAVPFDKQRDNNAYGWLGDNFLLWAELVLWKNSWFLVY